MKLYTGDLSPYSAKVRLQIYAKGIKDIAFVPPPAFMTGGFAQTSPLGRIPALDVNGDVIPESEVIAQYIEELYPQPNLLGTTPRARAQVRTVSRIADLVHESDDAVYGEYDGRASRHAEPSGSSGSTRLKAASPSSRTILGW